MGSSNCIEESPEIRQDNISAVPSHGGQGLGQTCEITPLNNEDFGRVTQFTEARFRPRQLEGICIESEQASAGLKEGQQRRRMAAMAQGAVDGGLTWLWREHLQDFLDHNRPVRAGRSFAGSEDFGDGRGVALGLVLLILVFEASRVLARIARSAAVGWGIRARSWGGGRVGHSSLYLRLEPRAFSTG